MSRPKSHNPSILLNVALSPEVRARMDLHLYSEVEERIPKGAYQTFLSARIREYFDWRQLDLTPFGFPAGYFVKGPKDMVERLKEALIEATEE